VTGPKDVNSLFDATELIKRVNERSTLAGVPTANSALLAASDFSSHIRPGTLP